MRGHDDFHLQLTLSVVMAGLVPAIHVLGFAMLQKTWMPGIKPGMTNEWQCGSLVVAGMTNFKGFAVAM
jgi:hypothetical protein